jgi:hypothetical protein
MYRYSTGNLTEELVIPNESTATDPIIKATYSSILSINQQRTV